METKPSAASKWMNIIPGILIAFGLYLATLYNYLFFHSIAEVFVIVVACGIFIVAWNSRRLLNNNYLLFIGIAYLFIAVLELMHTLAYSGMGIFEGYGTNLATQLWIAARYMESLSLLIAPLFFVRRIRSNILFVAYASATCLIFLSIFLWNIFPVCFVEGTGLTHFKKISEYIICLILLCSIVLLYQKRKEFEKGVYRLLIASIVLKVAAELAFLFYIHAYGFSNLVGHYFTIISFYLIYKAIIETGLVRPYGLIFRNLKQSEEALKDSRNMLKTVLDSIPSAVFWKDRNSIYLGGNRTWLDTAGLKSSEDVVGKSDYDLPWEKEQADSFRKDDSRVMASGIPEYDMIEPYLRSDGTPAWARTTKVPLRDGEGNVTGILGTYEDITEQAQREEEWRKLQAQLSNALEMAHLGHWEYDVAGDLFTFNDHFYKIFRTTAEEVGGYTMSSAEYAGRFVHPDDISVVAEEIRKAIEEADPNFRRKLEHRMVYSDGTVGHISVQFFIVKDAKGKTVKTYGVNQDITERKRIEEALREGEDRYRDLVENIHDLLCTHDLEGRILSVNRAAIDISGYGEDELVGKSLGDFVPPKNRPFLDEYLATIRKNGAASGLIAMLSKSGEKRIWEYNNTLRTKGVAEPIVRGYARDITESKQAEEALRKSEEHYRSIFEDSRDAIYITTRDGKFIDANQSTLDLFGYSREELASLNAVRLYADPDDAGTFQKDIGKKGFLRDYELTLRKKDGTEIDCLLNTTVRRASDGSILSYHGVIRDMTEQKKLEAQLLQAQKMESIGTMAGGIAHDFNNILGIIIGNTELAIDDVPEWNPAKGCLEEIRSASLRAKDVVRHILSFARKSVFERKSIQITSIIKDSLKLLRASIPTSIEIRQDLSCEHDTLLADPTQINQVLMNLCTNASHAMREEGGVLEVSLKNVDLESANEVLDLEPGRYVELSVSDTGPGIDSAIIDRIFDPYFTTKGLGEGTGMGLSVVHGIVKNHDGAVTVTSEPGKGTIFEVYFPLTEAEAVPDDKKESDVLPTGNEKILFVDDEKSLVKMAKRMLEMQGYQVESKTNPVEALELFRSKPDGFDLVITDMTMPNMTGDRLAKEILSIRPDMPIILCSGFSEKIDAEKAKKLGIRKYIEKPLNMSDFVVAVRKVLDEKKSSAHD
jgi:PAS domain S-box-containing protein